MMWREREEKNWENKGKNERQGKERSQEIVKGSRKTDSERKEKRGKQEMGLADSLVNVLVAVNSLYPPLVPPLFWVLELSYHWPLKSLLAF